MTLIAAYRAHTIPILLGDFLITGQGGKTSLRKKVKKLRPNLVVAWTGHLIVAEQAISFLESRLPDRLPTTNWLEETLADFTDFESSHLYAKVLGWILDDDGEHCFLWNSGWPSELFYDESNYDGSGHEVIQRFCGLNGIVGEPIPGVTHIARAIGSSLLVSSHLLSDQELNGISQGFGYAYEFLYLDQNEFKYCDDVLYVIANVHFDAQDNVIGFEQSGCIMKHLAFEEHSAIYMFDPSRRQKYLNLVSPVGFQDRATSDRIFQEAFEKVAGDTFPFLSKHYSIFLRFDSPGYSSLNVPVIFPSGQRQQFIQDIDEQGITLGCPLETVQRIYQTVRNRGKR